MTDENPEWLTQEMLDDGYRDAIAMVEAYAADDHLGLGTLFQAQDGQNAAGLVAALVNLLRGALDESGTNVAEWAARARSRLPEPPPGAMPQ